ncbi:MAG: energy transducer TonB [Flavipsychrobacter sp.]|nr:energy transducer TonB [Flavipsychrobacter sp.]
MDITLRNADYLDIIFRNRNKAYGGYELRRNYGNRVGKSLAILYSLLVAIILFSFTRKPHEEHEVIFDGTTVNSTWIEPPVHPIVPPVIPPQPATTSVKVRTDLFTEPDITTEEIPDDKHMTDVASLHKSTVGTGTEGDETTDIMPDNTTGKTGNVIPIETKPEAPRRFVEQMPQYNGDVNAYLAANVRYPEAARDAGIEGPVQIEFVVDEEGNVTQARVVRGIGGGCDQEALRVVAGMPRWKPGRQNGLPVKVFFNVVVKFRLQ